MDTVKVGYNTFYWVVKNTGRYHIGYNQEYITLGGCTFWLPNRTCKSASSLVNCRWTVLPPGEYIIESTDSWVPVGNNIATPSPLRVYVCEMKSPDSWFRELFEIHYKYENGRLYGYVGNKVVSERINYRGGIPSRACTYPVVYRNYCKFDAFTAIALSCPMIACVKIKPVRTVELRYDGSFNIPLYAFVDGELKWINAGEPVEASKIVSKGPTFTVHYDPLYPHAVRVDNWSCGTVVLFESKTIIDLDYKIEPGQITVIAKINNVGQDCVRTFKLTVDGRVVRTFTLRLKHGETVIKTFNLNISGNHTICIR